MSSRIIQDAFMNCAKDQKYINSAKSEGLTTLESKRLMQAVFGSCTCLAASGVDYPPEVKAERAQWKRGGVFSESSSDECLRAVSESLSQGLPVPIGISIAGGGGHEILVTKMDATNVYFMNPWGKLAYMPIEDCKQCLRGVSIVALNGASAETKQLMPPYLDDVKSYKLMPPSRYFDDHSFSDNPLANSTINPHQLQTYLTTIEGITLNPSFNLEKKELLDIVSVLDSSQRGLFLEQWPKVQSTEQAKTLIYLCEQVKSTTLGTQSSACLALIQTEGWTSRDLKASILNQIGNYFGLYE